MRKSSIKNQEDAEKAWASVTSNEEKDQLFMMVQQTILKKKNYLKEMLPLVQEQSVDPAKVSISNILQDNLSELKADIIQLQYWLDNKR